MQYAIVNSERTQAFMGGKGVCPTCGASMIAKCGPRILHHWAHAGRRNCDPWWENETEWHRKWKSLFPENCREVIHRDAAGEIHRADIKTDTGIIIEIQHSAISDQERLAREKFYQKLVWVIDGSVFKDNFDIYHLLPAPSSEVAKDIVWVKAERQLRGAASGIFFRLSEAKQENRDATKKTVRSGWCHFLPEIQEEINRAYQGHHQYAWVRPRKTWLDASCPVYIDFGDEWLARLEIYDESDLRCIRLISKIKFLNDVNTASDISVLGTHPI